MAITTIVSLCPGCFTDKGGSSVCPHCGYDESLKRGPLVLAHHTLLHNGQYLIGRVLGKPGGFGITYLALDTKLETLVAIKEYLPRDLAGREGGQATVSAHSSEDGEFFRFGLTQFLQEARTLAKFDHANIVRVRNFFEENGTGYLVMDYYDGVTLGDYLAQQPEGRLSEKTAIGILMPILDGLREVHAKEFLHRDIKPQNIYLTTDNRAILLDFGAARQAMGERSRSISVVLSEGYAPYEQYHRRGKQGPWVDIYACAAVLYHAVAGEAPPPATERVHKDELDTAGLGVSATLAEALRLALAVDHSKRPQRMTEFQALLLGDNDPGGFGSVEPPPVMQEPSTSAESNTDKRRRSQKAWGLSALAVIVVVTITSIGAWNLKEKAAPRNEVAAPASAPPASTVSTPAPTIVPDDPDTLLWNATKASGTRESLDAYLKQYPSGKYVELAVTAKQKAEREAIEQEQQATAAALATQADKEKAAQEVQRPLPSTPDPKAAVQVLFGLSAPRDTAKIAGNKLAKVWFSQLFQDESEQIFVVFVKVYTLDDIGKPKDCHACAPSIGAVTYKLVEGNWTVVGKQLDIVTMGNWGEAPNTKKAEIMELAKGHNAFLFEDSFSGQGITENHTIIVGYNQNKWQCLGGLLTGEDNKGACDDSPSGRKDPDMRRCWSFTGKISVKPEKNKKYPDIIVRRSGTNFDLDTRKIVPVGRVSYVFNGEKYIEANRLKQQ